MDRLSSDTRDSECRTRPGVRALKQSTLDGRIVPEKSSYVVEGIEVHMHHSKALLPTRATAGSVGYDLYSCEELVIPPGRRGVANTGISIEFPLPDGKETIYGRIAPRSGLAVKMGIDVGAGVVDPDYRGEIKVVLFNHGVEPFAVRVGDRVAQLIFERATLHNLYVLGIGEVQVREVSDPTRVRGEGGFGSTN